MTVMPTNELIGASLLGNEDLIATGSAFQATDPATGAALEPVYHNATSVDVGRAAALRVGRLRNLPAHLPRPPRRLPRLDRRGNRSTRLDTD